ncbi:MAG: hypothetical protein AVDCRST_MAG57-2631, partial [uncultured Blastococcus sp.]
AGIVSGSPAGAAQGGASTPTT